MRYDTLEYDDSETDSTTEFAVIVESEHDPEQYFYMYEHRDFLTLKAAQREARKQADIYKGRNVIVLKHECYRTTRTKATIVLEVQHSE